MTTLPLHCGYAAEEGLGLKKFRLPCRGTLFRRPSFSDSWRMSPVMAPVTRPLRSNMHVFRCMCMFGYLCISRCMCIYILYIEKCGPPPPPPPKIYRYGITPPSPPRNPRLDMTLTVIWEIHSEILNFSFLDPRSMMQECQIC